MMATSSKRTTHYETLGVAPEATRQEIRTAFRRLTRELHPDQFGERNRAAAEEKFQSITEAFNVLSRAESRRKYDASLATQSNQAPIRDPREMAKLYIAKAVECFRTAQLEEAERLLVAACYHDKDNGQAYYWLARTRFENPKTRREATRDIEKAAALEPNNAKVLAEAGRQFHEIGMKTRSKRYLDDALKIDPTESTARELSSRYAGDPEPEKTDSGGLFGRLMRKG